MTLSKLFLSLTPLLLLLAGGTAYADAVVVESGPVNRAVLLFSREL